MTEPAGGDPVARLNDMFGLRLADETEARNWVMSEEGRKRLREWWDNGPGGRWIVVPDGPVHPIDRICSGRPFNEALPARDVAEVDAQLAEIERLMQADAGDPG